MAEVGSAVCTFDFNPFTIGVWNLFYRALDFVVEARPSATGIEFVFGLIKRCTASFACICASAEFTIQFAAEGPFGAFAKYDMLLFLG